MATVINTPADVANLALRRIGYKLRVGSLLDGSEAASQLLDIYGQTRDQLLRQNDWNFAQGIIAGTVLKTAPPNYFDFPWSTNYPPPPWRFAYAYPADCLKVRSVRPQPGFNFNPAPQATLFAPANDATYTPTRQVILTNIENALIYYTRQVTNPTNWEADFIEAFADELAKRVQKVLTNTDQNQLQAAQEVGSLLVAERTQG